MSLNHRWDSILSELRHVGRYRELAAPHGVDFSSNNYLGYAGGDRRDLSLSPPGFAGGEGWGEGGWSRPNPPHPALSPAKPGERGE
jgi:hypothetical protein